MDFLFYICPMITEQQRNELETLKDQLTLPKFSTKVSVTTMNELLELGMVEIIKTKDNREFWRLTNIGVEILS